MELKIEKTTQETVELKLVKDGEGVSVKAVDESGGEWSLVLFDQEGYISRDYALSDALPFQLDNKGRIKIRNNN